MMSNKVTANSYSKFRCHFWNIAKGSLVGASVGAAIGYSTQGGNDYQCAEYVGNSRGMAVISPFVDAFCQKKLTVEMEFSEVMKLARLGYIENDPNPIWVLSLAFTGALIGAVISAYNCAQETNDAPRRPTI